MANRSNSIGGRKPDDKKDDDWGGFALGAGILAGVAALGYAVYNEMNKEEEKPKTIQPCYTNYASAGTVAPKMEGLSSHRPITARYSPPSSDSSDDEEQSDDDDKFLYRITPINVAYYSLAHEAESFTGNKTESSFGKFNKKTIKENPSHVQSILKLLIENVYETQTKKLLQHNIGVNRHNMWLNALMRELDSSFHQKGIQTTREKKFDCGENRSMYPDILIEGVAVVEVKCRNCNQSSDRSQAQKYADNINLRTYLVNFGQSGGQPTIKIYEPFARIPFETVHL